MRRSSVVCPAGCATVRHFVLAFCVGFAGSALAANYYVNDSSTNGDVYCSLPGVCTNSGLSPSTPKCSLAGIVNSYVLTTGDVVYVDTGEYSTTSTVTFTSADSGGSTNLLVIQGSTNAAAGGTVLTGSGYSSGIILSLGSGARYIRFADLTLKSASRGISITGPNPTAAELVRVVVKDCLNGIEILTGSNNRFQNCVVADCGAGFFSGANGGQVIDHCVFWSNAYVFTVGTSFSVSNSAVVGGIAFRGNDTALVDGDHTLFWNTQFRETAPFLPVLADLVSYAGRWSNSIYADPQFGDPSNGDFHPRSVVGRFVPSTGTVVTDTVHSALIDFGEPSSPAYTNEPDPNGTRLNAGAFGGTREASRSRTNAWVLAMSFNDGGTVTNTQWLRWNHGGITNTGRVRLDYSTNDGAAWSSIVTNWPVTNRPYAWNPAGAGSTLRGFWRLILEGNTNVWDANDSRFAIRESNAVFSLYVNDAGTALDVYASGAGNSTNTGLGPGQPKDSLQAVLDAYDLGAGDTVYVDTGAYTLSNAVVFGFGDQGAEGVPVVIRGSTNRPLDSTAFTIGSSLKDVFHVRNADFYRVTHVALRSGRFGVYLDGSDRCSFERVLSENNQYGFYGQTADSNHFLRCAARHNTYGLYSANNGWIWESGVSWSNSQAFNVPLVGGDRPLTVSNSVMVGGTAFGGLQAPAGDFSLIWDAVIQAGIISLVEFQKNENDWWHSTVANPLLANPTNRDFHPRSIRGRYDLATSSWVTDGVHSVAIDFGDPAHPAYTNELAPNGTRLNAGMYGGTAEASLSRTDHWVFAVSYNDGGTLSASIPSDAVYWNAGLPAGAKVRIELSGDDGETWSVAASNVLASAGSHMWSNTNFPSYKFARWRLVYEANTNVFDACNTNFIFRSGVFKYYLNDAGTSGDVYATEPGNDSNLGTTEGSPKLTLQSLLDTHDVEPGDIIYVDTGNYTLSANPVITFADSGDSNAYVLVQGSTNTASGGSIFTRQNEASTAYALQFNGARFVRLNDLALKKGGSGVRLDQSAEIILARVTCEENVNGFSALECTNVRLERAVATRNKENGVRAELSSNLVVESSVLWMNTQAGVRVVSAGSVVVSNSVAVASGAAAAAYVAHGTNNILGDYNDLYPVSNAVVGVIVSRGRNADTVAAWFEETGFEAHSLGVDPLFANAAGGDFHLRTTAPAGRYVPGSGFVTNDTVTSLLVDGGARAAAFGDEPSPNGARINIGLHGNAAEASKSPSAGWLHAASLEGGGWVRGTHLLHWVAGGAATGHTVKIEATLNGGESWSVLTNSIAAAAEEYGWDVSALSNSPACLWRVISNNDTNIWDQTAAFFSIRNQSLSVFVNDGATAGDLYCAGAGNPTNWVGTAARPLGSLASALAVYDLEPGDTLYVDTGTYTQAVDAVLSRKCSGGSNAYVFIAGSTNDVGSGSTIERGASATNQYGLHVNGAEWVSISNLVVRHAGVGVRFTEARLTAATGIRVFDSLNHGFEVSGSSNVVLRGSLAAGNAGRGLRNSGSVQVGWVNGVLWSNLQGAVQVSGGTVYITNSVLTASGLGKYVYEAGVGNIVADYNDLLAEDSASVGLLGATPAQKVFRWMQLTTNDVRSLSHDPLFADAGGGDYHPRSQGGRYLPGSGIVTDSVSSALIDTGNPLFLYANEPAPNGSRVNMGLYGNTGQASRSPTNASFTVLTLNDGGSVRGAATLYWVASAAATGHTVRIQYSTDKGTNWVDVATNVSASAGQTVWDTTLVGTYPRALWRVMSEVNPLAFDVTDSEFTINNGPLSYYVNDSSTNGNVYTTAASSPSFDGLAPDTPLPSLFDVLNLYVLRAGDTVYVDTGSYTQNTDAVVSQVVAENTNRLTIVGSTNYAAGGTVIYRGGSGNGLLLQRSQFVDVRHLAFDGGSTGVSLTESTNCVFQFVSARNAATGFSVADSGEIRFEHCVAGGHSSRGLYGLRSLNTVWQSGVLWSNGYGAYAEGGTQGALSISNSVIGAFGDGRYAYYWLSGRLYADYNDLFLTNGARAAQVATGQVAYAQVTVSRWARDAGQDRRSLTHEPRFANAAAGDFHPKSQAGRFDPSSGLVVTDAVTSVLVDAGPAGWAFASEPAPNGSRINLGAFANTAEASRTPTNASFTVISLNDGGRIEGTNYLYWIARGDATGHTARLEFSPDGGATWTNITTNASASADAYLWNTLPYASTIRGVWRIVSAKDAGVTDQSDSWFALRNTPLSFYVNDAGTNGDVYATGPGAPGNLGATADQPALSIQTVLDAWDLEPGDVVYVDTGSYAPASVVTVGSFDQGGGTNRVTIQGSTNDAAGGTVLWTNGVKASGAESVAFRNLRIRNASVGVSLLNSMTGLVEWCEAADCGTGFEINASDGAVLLHNVARGGTKGVDHEGGSRAVVWRNGVVWSNDMGVYFAGGPSAFLQVENSVIGVRAANDYGFYYLQSGTLTSDYNNVLVAQHANAGFKQIGTTITVYQNLARWVRDFGQDAHSLSHDALFVDPDGGDFHLRSQGGRNIGPGVFTNDAVTSPLIDAGHPLSDFAAETLPNGARVNIGRYGASGQASRTPTNGALTAVSLNDGGRVEGMFPLQWVARGAATGHQVRIEYSGDAGGTWTVIASNVAASAGQVTWDSTAYASSILGVWRIGSQTDSSVTDTSDVFFAVRNLPLSFYVNDASTNGDVYTTSAGVGSNYGAAPATPKASVQDVLDRWDLEPGDTIYVDTGAYFPTGAVSVGSFDAGGTTTNRVTIQGSTNLLAGGTVLWSNGVSVVSANGVGVRHLTMRSASAGVRFSTAQDCLVEWTTALGGQTGFEVSSSRNTLLRHCAARSCSLGVYNSSGTATDTTTWESGILWSNNWGVQMSGGTMLFSNSIVGVFGSGRYGYQLSGNPPTLRADYNDFFLQNDGYPAYKQLSGQVTPTIYQTVSRWARDYGEDRHTLSHDPRFADSVAGDFHLRSRGGRFAPTNGTFMADADTSPLIDAGAPVAEYAAESSPNGARLNIGLYGNTPEASRSPSNETDSVLTAITASDGGRLEGLVALFWAASGPVTGHTARLDYSADGGQSWSVIATGLQVSAGAYEWNSTLHTSSMLGRWKITSTSNTNLTDATDNVFALRNTPLSFYVNDLGSAGDVYCTALGSSTNLGVAPSGPQASVQAVLALWDLEPGDTVYVDTGAYTLSDPITVGSFDAGTATNRVTLQGSTNDAAGGSILTKFGGGDGIYIDTADGIAVRNLTIRNAGNGLHTYRANYGLAEWVKCEDGSRGFYLDTTTDFELRHCAALDNTEAGIRNRQSSSTTWESGVLWNNRSGTYADGGALRVGNTAIGAVSAGSSAHFISSGSISSEYNAIYLQSGGVAASVLSGGVGSGTQRYAAVYSWAAYSGQDRKSLTANPLFADASGGDFHLRSTAGRYSNGVDVVDAETSPLMDAGNPASDYSAERDPDGGRINIGLYGNSAQSSLTPTNPGLTIVSLDGGGTVTGIVALCWIARGSVTSQTVALDVSSDGGLTWSNVSVGLPATADCVDWNSATMPNSVQGLWRVYTEGPPLVSATSAVTFILRNGGGISYYVNDGSTLSDVYATAAGSATNTGDRPSAPKASIQAVLDAYDLEPGDRIFVDTGTYNLSANVVIGELDAGTVSNRVVIQGSTNAAAGGSVLDRQAPESSVAVQIYESGGIHVRDLTVKGAAEGLQVYKSPGCLVERVRAEDNANYGLSIQQTSVDFSRCVARNNGACGLSVFGQATWHHGVIWSAGDAVRFANGSAVFSNSIFRAAGSASRVFRLGLGGSVQGDYNAFIRSEGAYIAQKDNASGGNDYYPSLSAWAKGYGQDQHSFATDLTAFPEENFADVLNGDFHLRSVVGRHLPGSGLVTDTIHSVLIDIGSPGSGYTNEPAPNGGRLNIGAYGATAEASLSRTNPWLNAVSVNDGGLLLGTNILYWQSGGLATDDAVRIEYSPNNGVEWYILVTNLPVTSESYPWDVVGLTPTVLGRWRVINEENENLIDTNDTAFSIRNEPQVYYVNDTSQVYDVYCTAPGHPTNTGKSASAPMDSPASLLARYPIGFGDTIYLDTGYYLVSNNLVLNELNRGESGFPIRVIGSTNAAGTVIDRGSTNAAEQAYGFRITNTRYVSLEHLRFTGAGVGVGVDGSIRCSLNGVQAYSNLGAGVSCGFVDLRADHCASWANGGAGLVAGFAGAVIWEHGVIWSNGGNAFEASLGTVWMSNSVAHASGSGGTGVVYVFTRNLGTILSDYNLFLRGAGAGLGRDLFYQATFNTLLDWQSASGGDRHTLLADPLFADASRGDFHVRSRQGRWVPGTGYVTTDTVTSWAIDAGAPASAYTNEPAPNGSRANIGLYGNSAEASLSDTNRGLLAVNLNDGGSVKGVVKLYWVSRGFGTADTVRLRFSTDNGLSWTNIATNISVTADGFDWNPQGYPSTPVGRWEVQSESDPGVSDASDQAFFLRVGPFSFFVNDASTANDVFCDDIGRTTNLGTSAFTPKSTIQEILDSYDIDGGDTIFVDTGHYALTNSDTFGLLDSGIATSFVRVVGSTNIWGQGTILDRFTTNALKSPGLIFNYAQYVKVQDVVIQNASIGLSYNGALRCVASNVLVRDSGKGASMSLSTSNLFERCAFSRVNGGVASSLGTGHKLDRCVIWSNTADAIVVQGGTFEVIHSAVEVVATNYCYAMSFGGSLMADYNDLFLRDRAAIALQESLPLERMPQWIARTTQDVHSLSMDPLWGGPTNDDFHPMSASGRTDPLLGVVFDAETSYLIDTGDPAASWTNEPVPNGGRRNIGLYGGTPEASRSRTNAWLLAITAMAGGRAEGVFYLVWAAGALDSTNRVQLDYSYDNGSSWTPIANDLAVYDGQYLWNSAEQVSNVFVFAPSPIARWRVVLQSNTNVQDVTDQYFALRNVPFTYYVNDASLTNDLYTSAPGDDANLGIFSYAPKATLRSLLDVLDVEGGDTIYLDTGLYAYPNSNLVVLGKADEGRVGQPVVIQGSTAVGGTILDRASYGANDHVFSLQGDYFTVRDLRLKGGNVSGQSSGLVLERLSVTNGYVVVTGIGVTMSDLGVDGGRVSVSATNASLARLRIRNDGLYLQGANLAVQNLLAYGGTGSGVRVHGANAAVIRNATLAPGTHPYWQTGSADATLKDSILVADGPNDLCLNVDGGTLVSDYNNLVARGGASIGARNGIWEALLYWQRESGQDPHSLALEPYFADEAGGDYHLKSAGGRWTGSGYTNDTVTSPCIDTGDPLGAYATEPDPDGGRVNLGAYGNTLDASLSRTGAWLRVMTVNDGGVLRGTNTLRWTGGNLPGGALLSLQYSTDHGSSWINIATNVDALAGEYAWNTSTITNSLFTLWRAVVQSAPGVNSQTENEFPIRNAPYKFYVNDPATANDVYCTGAGSPANSALTEALPMESVEHVLSTYDTEGQDTVYVDTGTYAVPSDIFLRWSRGGDSNLGAVVIQGSTNLAAGGSVFLRGNTNAGSDTFEIRGSYVTLRSLTLRGANQAVALESMRSAGLERLLVQSNAMGIHISTCDVVWVRNNRFAQNAAGGLRMRSSQRVTVENNTFYGNRPYAVEVLSSLNVTLQNNIVSMTTNSTTAYNGEITQPFMDYNVYHFAAPATYIYGAYNDLRLWQLASMHDYRSEITNPLYADEAAGDFHPQSTQGRFQDGTGWVTDSADSWAIDKGNPFSDYGLEPTNNGGRVNIGYDGNTEFASRGAGPTGVVVFARTGNGALVINSSPWPLIWSVLRVPSNLLFSVQYSGDGGVVWSNITTGVSAYQEYILWNLSPFYNSYKGRWRVVGEGVGNTNYWDLNDADMEIFFGEFDISSITRPEGLGAIVWRGAWDETYQVQYASNYDRVARSYVWTNAVDGPATNQKAFFLSTRGGDFEYQDVESTNKGWRAYRVLWQQE